MQSNSKNKCGSASHQAMVENAKNRLEDLHDRFSDLQAARKEGRAVDVAVLEEQVYQSLREWKAELSAPSPAPSFVDGSLGFFSDEINRMLQLCEEEDDAISPLAEQADLKAETDIQTFDPVSLADIPEEFLVNDPQDHVFQGFDTCKTSTSNLQTTEELNLHQGFNHGLSFAEIVPNDASKDACLNVLPNICPPPSAFMGPKCALWDCTRPAQACELCQDYCSTYHATLAVNEECPGVTPVLRPRGIGLKDNLLLDALRAKARGKDVGIPECEGAASMKSPWNSTELFDLSLLDGETIREWLFFDKPRRAFESGNRKQRSLPDYTGRGWHESRKLVMKEYGGQRRSYYMDPQPPGSFEWHLFEYELNGYDVCALYKLELKIAGEKRSPKTKVMKDSLADLQKKMDRLTAQVPGDDSPLHQNWAEVNKESTLGDLNTGKKLSR